MKSGMLALFLVLGAQAGTFAATINVSTSAEIVTTLGTAQGGDVLLLAPGNYGSLGFTNKSFASYVTLRSADANNRAVFSSIYIGNCNYVRLEKIVLHHPLQPGEPDFLRAFQVENCSHFEVLDSELFGSDDGIVDNDCYGLGLNGTSNLRIENCTFHDWLRGLIVGGGDNIVVRGNTFHDIRSDGSDFGGVVNCLVENNTYFTFSQYGEDHPDGIQFWNDGGTRVMRDVIIRGNHILQGHGAPYQSIFIQSNTPAFRNANFLIEHNVVYNGHLHGITVSETDGVTIRHNTILQSHNPGSVAGTPSINAYSCTGVVAEDNVATAYGLVGSAQTARNITAQKANPALDTHYDRLFLNAQAGANLTANDLRPRPGSILIVNPGADIGALEFVNNPSVLTAYILTDVSQGGAALTVNFDGSLSAGPQGTIIGWHWDFDDGSDAHGAVVSHVYTDPGTYHATLTVTNSLNQTAVANKTIRVTDPPVIGLIYGLNLDGHILDSSATHIASNWTGASSYAPGIDGEAASFNGQPLTAGGSAISAANDPSLYGMANLSVALWVKKNNAAAAGRLLWTHVRYGIAVDFNSVEFSLWPGGVTTRPSVIVPALNDTGWHHVAMTYDGASLKGYVDGFLVHTTTGLSGSIDLDGGHNLVTGADPFSNAFNGLLDEVRVYNIALTVQEIQNLMQIAPSTLTAAAAGARIDLTWIHTAHTEAGFEIERKTGAGGTFALLATVPANTTAYSDTSAVVGTEYHYRVRAVNGASASGYSNIANATVPQPNRAPECASAPSAAPNPAGVNAAVTFTAVASDADGDALSYAWSFSDGAPTQNGATVARTFSAPGTYNATVTVSDGQAQVTAQVTVTIQAAAVPPADNNDGGGTGTTPKGFTVARLLGSVRFDVSGKDSVQVSGTLPELPAGFAPGGARVTLDVGGAAASFTLNTKGAAKTAQGSFALQTPRGKKKAAAGAAFKATLRNGAWADEWADEDMAPNAAESATVRVTLDLNGTLYAADVAVKCSGKSGVVRFRK